MACVFPYLPTYLPSSATVQVPRMYEGANRVRQGRAWLFFFFFFFFLSFFFSGEEDRGN
jgi:hypothetical protein